MLYITVYRSIPMKQTIKLNPNEGKIGKDAYCYVCTARIEFCRCEIGEGANRL